MARSTTTTTVKRAVTDACYMSDTCCTFCGRAIHAATRHYEVAGIGPMCSSCYDLSLIVRDARGIACIELAYTIHASKAFRII